MNEKDLFILIGFVKVSRYRVNVLNAIGTSYKMPSEIAREVDLRTSQVSRVLADLKRENLVVCINENVRKGRLYKCTSLGFQIMKYI